MTLGRLLLVVLGGMLGTAGRLGIGLLVPDAAGIPLATLSVNIFGALLIGLLAARLPRASGTRVFLGTGILGGFTTYSAFVVGSVELWSSTPLVAVAYAVLTLGLGIAAAAAGLRLGRPGPRARSQR
ncbi:fluoride efflux transporter FluC [Microbacterium abyssi]|uniref:fluoride efflux transporter FluC n=1 Tax=Microbacterium abyssi TaxID=2782166 RepID=UPI001E5426AB|nr:CrcB family protein [Microbacterium sp. A18JL241]